jgi:UDP-N-acetylmuramoylalanine--D-glutamate ligase
MLALKDKSVLVIGLGHRGQAACALLQRCGARATGVDSADTPELREGAEKLRELGVNVTLGATTVPAGSYALAVLSPAVPTNSPLLQAVRQAGWPLVSELELGFQQAQCLGIAVTGTNGKGTTAELIECALTHAQRQTVVCGHRSRPVCSVVEQSKDLDYLILQANAFQLEATELFRPSVAVLLNLAPDHLDRFATADDYVRASARLFRNQQPFDWAIIQSEAMARLRQLELPVPAKIITFSSTDPKADLYLDRGLLLSRLPGWSGPLLDMDHCHLRGPHNAENLMAALAVGHVLRLPLETMAESMKAFSAGPHRFQLVAEVNGVQFINDSKATNPDALQKALLAVRPGPRGEANVWLIAGGKDKGLGFHDLAPVISKRVKRVFLVGETAEKIRAAWSLFTPCTLSGSLVEALGEAARDATSGDVVLLSPACSSFDQFRDYQHRGEVFCTAVKTICGGAQSGNPNIDGEF